MSHSQRTPQSPLRVPPTHLLGTLESVSRLGSLSAAAKELHLTVSAISHRLSSLESYLGQQLFIRTRDGVKPTEEGVRYSRIVRSLLREMISLSADPAREPSQRCLRIRASPAFVSVWLLPRLSDFSEKHPDIRLDVVSSFERVDFQRDPVDVWLARGFWDFGGLFVEHLFAECFVPLAAPLLMERQPVSSPNDIKNAPLIFCSRSIPSWNDWFLRHGIVDKRLDWSIAFSNAIHSMVHAVDSAGYILESLEFSQGYRRSGQLVEVFPNDPGIEGLGIFFVCSEAAYMSSALRQFKSWLITARDQWRSESI